MNDDNNPIAMAFGCVFAIVMAVIGMIFYAGGALTVLSFFFGILHAIFGGHQ